MTRMGFIRINEDETEVELTDQGLAFYRGWDWGELEFIKSKYWK